MTLEAEPVSPGEALSGKLSGKYLVSSVLPNFTYLVLLLLIIKTVKYSKE